MKASAYGHIEVVAMLLEKGPDLEAKCASADDQTALLMASNKGHLTWYPYCLKTVPTLRVVIPLVIPLC